MVWLGAVHFALALTALVVGAGLFLRAKGTPQHRRWGHVFVAVMLVSNTIVFGIYEDSHSPGVFHALAIISLASISVAFALARYAGSSLARRIAHGHVMLWSYGGLVAAGLGQGATALGHSPWPLIVSAFAVVALVAIRLDFPGMLRNR